VTLLITAVERLRGILGMLGIEDPWIWSAYLFSFGLALFCVVYGWLRFNEEEEEEDELDG